MNPQLANIIERAMNGEFDNHPIMQKIYAMLQGKDSNQALQTILNMLQSQGYNIYEKKFTAQDLQRFGINIPTRVDHSSQELNNNNSNL